MKRFILLIALFISLTILQAQQQQYSRVKIPAGIPELMQIAQAGIDVTEGTIQKQGFYIAELSENELLKLADLGFSYEVIIEDVSTYYVKRNEGKSTNIDDYKGTSDWPVPENFTFGSMSGHITFAEMMDQLDNMVDLYPDLITEKESIGQTDQGRDLWMVKLSDNPGENEEEPEVLYTSLHHAREPAGLMTNLYFMWYLLENYASDPLIQALVDNTELYFLPVLNPDGYVYNETTNPSGGGMWRKNRVDNGIPGCEGVDLNRNYGYEWGFDNIGSSPDPCEATYRGEAPFSELETQAIRDFCEAHEFVNALNYHTYGNLLLYAWGYTEEPSEDDATFFAHSVLYTIDSHYTFGAGSTTIYPTNGGSDDWMYGEQTTKNKIFAYTPELGESSDGFWCAIDRIVPIAQENMIMNILAAAFAGWYAGVELESFPLMSETEGYLKYDVTRLGLKDDGVFTVTFEPMSDVILTETLTKTYESMDILENIQDSIPFSLNVGTPSGTSIKWLVSVDNGMFVLKDTLIKIFGEAQVVVEDPCNDLENWITPNWAVTTGSYVSPTGSITDSPGGNYPNSHLSAVFFEEEVDLADAGFAMLDFWAKWEIEQGYDFVQIMASTNGGTSWEALAGEYTVTGSPYQAEGEPVYDGFQTEWVHEQIDLSDYIGQSVLFRFFLKSDNWVTEDGFYFDDFRVSFVEISPVGIGEPVMGSGIQLSDPRPNPASSFATLNYSFIEDHINPVFKVYNATGQEVYTEALSSTNGTIRMELGNWQPGVYYYFMENYGNRSETGKIVVVR